MNKYGLLFAGCGHMGPEGYNIRYKNDLEYMYTVLVNRYSYGKENVDVCLANGVDIIDRISSQVIKTQPGTYSNFKNALEKYINTKPEDQLVIMISNHGGRKDNSAFILGFYPYERKDIMLDEFKELINAIPCRKIIIMGQCYAGNFLDSELKNTIILTANKPDDVSYARVPVGYDEFLYHFIAFMDNIYPDGSPLNYVPFDCSDKNLENAYLYVKASDRYCNGTFYLNREEPQICENDLVAKDLYL